MREWILGNVQANQPVLLRLQCGLSSYRQSTQAKLVTCLGCFAV
ncbi:uncharacterized protein METZ01_LOCUS76682, partial [marine metagenome]